MHTGQLSTNILSIPLQTSDPFTAFEPSEIMALDNSSAQGYSCITNTSKNWFFQHFHAASFPDGGLPRPESVTVKVAFSHGLNEALLHTLKPLR